MSELLHYGRLPLIYVRSVDQPAEPDRKPRGLWVSVGDGEDSWREWCESEKYCLDNLAHITQIELAKSANIIRLSSATEIDQFHDRFSAPAEYERRATWRWPVANIGWKAVAKQYDGIIIAPYIWDRRLDGKTGWYYTWDVASGCIWNADAISELIDRGPYVPKREAA